SATTASALTGTGGSRSARSGGTADGQWTELRTPFVTLRGDELLTFQSYVSCEDGYDGLYIYVYDAFGVIYVYGDPSIDLPYLSGDGPVFTSISYPASHPNTIAVGASTDRDLRSDYSQYGAGLDFLAPSSGGWNGITTTDRS